MSFAPNLNLGNVNGLVGHIAARATPLSFQEKDPNKDVKARLDKLERSKPEKADKPYKQPKTKRQPAVKGTVPSFSDGSTPGQASPVPQGRPPMPSFSAGGGGNPFLPGPMEPSSQRLHDFLTRPVGGITPTSRPRPTGSLSFSHPEDAPESPSAPSGSASAVFSHPEPAPRPLGPPAPPRVVPAAGSTTATSMPTTTPTFPGRPFVPAPHGPQLGNVGAQFSHTEPTVAATPTPFGPTGAMFSHVKPIAEGAAKAMPYFLD